jgi:hypothetical protein
MNRLETIAIKRKEKALATNSEFIKNLSGAVADSIIGEVGEKNFALRKQIRGDIAQLAKLVAEINVNDGRFGLFDNSAMQRLETGLKSMGDTALTKDQLDERVSELATNFGHVQKALDILLSASGDNGDKIDNLNTNIGKMIETLAQDRQRDVVFKYEQRPATDYINVRLTDGTKFIDRIGRGGGVVSAGAQPDKNYAIVKKVVGLIKYVATALPGSGTADAVWRVMKVDNSVTGQSLITWADGNDLFDNIASDIESLVYS